MKKGLLAGVLSGIMLLSAMICVPGLAAPDETPPGEESPTVTDETGEPVSPDDYIRIDDPLTHQGTEWVQPIGYNHFCIWIENTTDQTMKVTLTMPEFQLTGDPIKDGAVLDVNAANLAMLRSIAPHSSVTATFNYISTGRCYVACSTPDGSLSGSIRVRVSNVPL